MKTYPGAAQRYKAIYDMRTRGKPTREVAIAFGISVQRVHQILAKYERITRAEQEMRESHDPLLRALDNGSISRKVYRSLVRGGYGKTFHFDDLLLWLRSDTFIPEDFRHFGSKSLDQLRRAFLNQDEIHAIDPIEARVGR